jgi:hypothetical protein
MGKIDNEWPRLAPAERLKRLRETRAGYPPGHTDIEWIDRQIAEVEKEVARVKSN